jgi:hypothetical protein
MDCYLFEGQKVLYRISLAIIQLYTRSKYLFFFLNLSILNERVLILTDPVIHALEKID